MAFPTAVNDQITDSVTQVNIKDPRESIEGVAHELLGELIRALGVAKQKGMTDQHQASTITQAASAVGINLLNSIDNKGSRDKS